jgi:rod shape-determining protein MreC
MQVGFLTKRRNLILGALLALVALGMFTSGRVDGGPVGRSASLVGAEPQSAVDGVGQFFGGLWRLVGGGPSEKELLRTEVETLRRDLVKVKEIEQENARLSALLDFKKSTDLQMVPARVVGRSAMAWYRTLVLDRGLSSGVRSGCAVVTSAGAVGRIYEVSGGSSRVMLLTDASSAVDAIVQRTRAQVIVEGNLSARPNLLYLAKGVDAEEGDQIVTSGLDGIYPKGLLLGTLVNLRASPGEIFREAKLEPSVDFGRIEEVLIVLSQGEMIP